ncbi:MULTISPECIES: alginate O-acetyltransferase [unclassified Pseudomonas]|uniref:alginate O-acetyltransferase n=1 Tax=unclassified Pseudomonas TaxID=196821 RepID=UPI002AC93440|nr:MULTISPECIES: alginate O-acetyltransferase [unclassified Pseudomonas]MEB0042910.1 alginate O-acetyltransferase [Pseudomonas sp. MH10]MEB0077643.1 alginate O-acetyltransferase [Pseudomonas sp. MH10out]MEB0094381.1 alginate O-acetyltransferase [Pseudomonas sp. CCI4.2]MEB0101792.1 alginate O-acetyltransferase [Pseudomonas sp. CCI3.2]MEB0121635.1 alginate O-acetyltransferase [Pseudomonas sp. CCI1.2]
MTRSFRILYIALFLGILLALGAWSLRSFASFSTSAETTVLNGRWTKAAEVHYDGQFPIKRLGTNLWAALDFKLFNEGRPGVVLGSDQWLYSDEEFNPVANGAQNEADNLALIQGVRDALKKQGTQLVLAIVPAKTRLYPEHLGANYPAALHTDLYQQFHSQVAQAGILAPDLLQPLQTAKQTGPVFLRTDTHWTPMGAEVVAQRLGATIAADTPLSGEPERFITETKETAPYKGDLTTFLPLDPLFSDLLPTPDDLQQRSTNPVPTQTSSDDELFASTDVPVVLVGTSYSANPNWNFLGALKQALHSDVVNYAEDGHGPILPMLKYLQTDAFKNSPPQVLIWEFPERYLPAHNDLGEFDPQWIAELKKARDPQQNLALTANNAESPHRAQN